MAKNTFVIEKQSRFDFDETVDLLLAEAERIT